VRNLFDRSYVGSVVVNAAGGRYYEPAAGRWITAGLAIR
jgi:iron complex outermembrane receptor protein